MSLYPPGAIFCRACGYCLFGLPENRCPECGRAFDPADPKSFRRRPRRMWVRRLLLWGGGLFLLLLVAYGSFLGWLYMGWKAEAPARALATGQYDGVKTRSILPPALSPLLVGPCRSWQERVDTLAVRSHPLKAEEVRAIGACHRLRRLALYGTALNAQDVAALCACRQLEELLLENLGLHSQDLNPLAGLLHLKRLDLSGNTQLDDAALPLIVRLGQLESLNLSGTTITDGGLAQLSALTNLRQLHLNRCPNLTDAAAPHLARLTGLKVLALYATRLTPKATAMLKRALPQCRVSGPGLLSG